MYSHLKNSALVGLAVLLFAGVSQARIAIPREGNRPLSAMTNEESIEDYSLNDSFSELGGEPVKRAPKKKRAMKPEFSALTASSELPNVTNDAAPSAAEQPSQPANSSYYKREKSVKKSAGKKVVRQKTTKRTVRTVTKKKGDDPVVKSLESDIQGDYYEPLSDADFQPQPSASPESVEPAGLD